MVSTYLLVTVALRGSVGIVQPFENGVFPKHLLDFQNCLLTTALFGKLGFLSFLLSSQLIIVSEQVELLGLRIPFHIVLMDQVVDG